MRSPNHTKKKVTLSLDRTVYEGIRARVGERKVGEYLSELARPHVSPEAQAASYRALAQDSDREAEAADWLATDDPIAAENVWHG